MQPARGVLKAVGDPALQHWPTDAAVQINALIKANAHRGAYAVFDADNTSYHHDLMGALLPFMEMRGVLTRDTMHPSLEIIPFRDSATHREGLHSYYFRLGEIDDQVGYPWVSQIFSGFTLRQLKGHVDDMLASGNPIPAEVFEGDVVRTIQVEPPRLQLPTEVDGGVRLSFPVETNRLYRLQRSLDLRNWSDVVATNSTGGTVAVDDGGTVGTVAGFYRVRIGQ